MATRVDVPLTSIIYNSRRYTRVSKKLWQFGNI